MARGDPARSACSLRERRSSSLSCMGLLLVTGETLLPECRGGLSWHLGNGRVGGSNDRAYGATLAVTGWMPAGTVVEPSGTTTVPPVWTGNVVLPAGTVVSVGSPEPLITETV